MSTDRISSTASAGTASGLEPKTRLEYFLNKIAENGGSGSSSGGGSVLVIPDTNEKVDIVTASPNTPGDTITTRGIMVDTEMDIGTVIVEAHPIDGTPYMEYKMSPRWTYVTMSGVDPSQVLKNNYTFTGSRIACLFGENLDLAIVPPSLAKDLIPGTYFPGGIA